MDQYLPCAGFVQKFGDKEAVTERDANNQKIIEFTIKTMGSGKLVRVTLWPEMQGTPIKAGDFIATEGKLTISDQNGKTYYGINAKSLLVNGTLVQPQERSVSNQQETTSSPASDGDFPL